MNRKGSLISLLILVALAVGGLAWPTYGQRTSPLDNRHNKMKAFTILKQRAATIAAKLRSSNAAEVRQARGDWNKLIADFKGWETRYSVTPETRRYKLEQAPMGGERTAGGGGTGGGGTAGGTGGGPSGGYVGCEPRKETDFFWCILERSGRNPDGTAVCIYRCYKN